MNQDTRAALVGLNDRFYTDLAADFSDHRQQPWPGWERLPAMLTPGATVLDAGCGNGRLGKYLMGQVELAGYLGVDGSGPMLAIARQQLAEASDRPDPPTIELRAVDLDRDLPGWLRSRRFAMVVLFAVLHHVPGAASRQALIRRLAELVAPGGQLVFTVWRFAEVADLAAKRVPWDRVEEVLGHHLDRSQLEPEDFVLGWKHQTNSLRYCRAVDDDELNELVAASGLRLAAAWSADGRSRDLNRYLALERPRA